MEFTSRQLRAFHLVAQHRNFTRAAEALFITPSGLSVLIQELERQLGFRVFNRTTRQVSLTAQGSELLAVTRPALNALEEGMSRIEQAVKRKSRRILIGTTPWFAAHVLPPAIKEFRDKHPDLQVQMFDGNLGPISSDAETVAFWALSGETLISLTKDYPHEQLIQKQLAKMGIVCKRGQTVNLLDTQIGLVEAGLGVAVIPSFGALASRDRKVRITDLNPVVTLEFYEISNRGRRLPAEALEFSAFLKTYMARRVSNR